MKNRTMRTMSNETRAKKMIYMIYNENATWEDVAEALKLCVSYCRKIVREHYKSETAYNKLLAKARENARHKKEADELISVVEVGADEAEVKLDDEFDVLSEVKHQHLVEERKNVVLMETGYMLDVGLSGIMNESLDVFMPAFNIKELEKLTRSIQVAEEILTLYYSTYRITPVHLEGKEELFNQPVELVKPRTIGVVAVACHLWANNYKVILKTNSKEVERLAKQQGIDIDVVRIQKPQVLKKRLADVC